MTPETRTGACIQTFTGREVFPLDPRPADIDILDIAHSLSCQGRFTGHTRFFYSTAEHSVRVSRVVQFLDGTQAEQMAGLLHDGGEAYMADLSRPVKHDPAMQAYRSAEKHLGSVVLQAFGLGPEEPAIVKQADGIMLGIEARYLIAPFTVPERWREWLAMIPENLVMEIRNPWIPRLAERMFLARFVGLGGKVEQ